MKKLVWLVGGMCAAAAGCLVFGSRRMGPVQEDPAQRTEDAWSEDSTAA